MRFLVYMYYMHSGYQTSIFGKNCAYYIQIFTVQHDNWKTVRNSTYFVIIHFVIAYRLSIGIKISDL